MLYNSIISRSFSKHEQKKFGYRALVGCCLILFSFFLMLRSHLQAPLPISIKMVMNGDEIINSQKLPEDVFVLKKTEPRCSFMEKTDVCDINVDVRIHGESSSVFFTSTDKKILQDNSTWKIRPYARKTDQIAMSKTKEWSIKAVENSQKLPQCTRNHNVPAILFSNGGYAGNHFHEFTDMLVPLFITARKFNRNVQFLVTDRRSVWISKYNAVLSKLSKYDIIDIDAKTEVHCFPSVNVGLQRDEKELTIEAEKHSYSMRDFKEFLRSSYSLKRAKAMEMIKGGRKRKPQLLIVARRKTRSFTNTAEISRMARKLGFKVIVAEPDENLKKVAETVNSCDVVMGVHGAGLTNIVFLPENAVLIQIVPFGGAEWVAENFFGEPSKEMGIKYLEYKIRLEESTLIQQYPIDDVVLRDPGAIYKKGWAAFKSIYFDKQNVNLNVTRFEPTLLKALQLLHH